MIKNSQQTKNGREILQSIECPFSGLLFKTVLKILASELGKNKTKTKEIKTYRMKRKKLNCP